MASIELALVKLWRAVQVLALPRFRPIVLAVPPLYVPEKVRVVSVAVRSARFPPKAIPEMVELARSVLATVAQVAAPRADRERTNWLVHEVPAYSAKVPLALVRVRAEVKPETAKSFDTARLVLVALVVVPLVTVRAEMVDEEYAVSPPLN